MLIKVDLLVLDNAIKRMASLTTKWSGNSTLPPVTVGGGKTVNELEEIAKLYQEMNNSMVSLAANTTAFLNSIKESYEESDRNAKWNLFQR